MALPTVNASHVHVKNLDTGTVYYTKGSGTTQCYSTCKLLTAYVVRLSKPTSGDLDEQVTIVSDDLTAGGTGANLTAGNVLTIRQLLMNMLVPSSNNSAMALARVIGQEFLDVESGGVGDPVARFVTEMDSVSTTLGLGSPTWSDPHGNNETSVCTPEAINLIWPYIRSDTQVTPLMRWGRYNIDPISGADKVVSTTNDMGGDSGVWIGKTGSGSAYNLTVLWEAPNGQIVAVTVMGCTSNANRLADVRAIIAQLPTDYSVLATSAVPWTPARIFSELSCGGGWWDASDLSTLWQDTAATTPVTSNDDPVARWDIKAGSSGAYWRQATGSAQPLWKSADNSLLFDGTNDFLDLGGPTIGSTGLYANSTNEWMVYIRLKTTDTLGAIIAKAVASSASRTFYIYIDTSVSSSPGFTLRGATAGYAQNLDSGSIVSVGSFRDGSTATITRSEGNFRQADGSASENSTENILLGARTEASPTTFLAGGIYQVVIADAFDDDQFFRLRAWMQGAAVNAYADPTGGVGGPPTLSDLKAVSVTATTVQGTYDYAF